MKRKGLEKHMLTFGESYGMTRKRIKGQSVLDLPLSVHLDKNGASLTAQEAESKARGLSKYYTSERQLTMALDEYLKGRGFSPEEHAIVMEIRQMHNDVVSRATRSTRHANVAGSSSVYGASGSNSHSNMQQASTSAVSQHADVGPYVPLPPSPPQQHEVEIDPDDSEAWQWLDRILNS